MSGRRHRWVWRAFTKGRVPICGQWPASVFQQDTLFLRKPLGRCGLIFNLNEFPSSKVLGEEQVDKMLLRWVKEGNSIIFFLIFNLILYWNVVDIQYQLQVYQVIIIHSLKAYIPLIVIINYFIHSPWCTIYIFITYFVHDSLRWKKASFFWKLRCWFRGLPRWRYW